MTYQVFLSPVKAIHADHLNGIAGQALKEAQQCGFTAARRRGQHDEDSSPLFTLERGEDLQQVEKDFIYRSPGVLRENLDAVDRYGIFDHLFSHLKTPPFDPFTTALAVFSGICPVFHASGIYSAIYFTIYLPWWQQINPAGTAVLNLRVTPQRTLPQSRFACQLPLGGSLLV